MLGFKRNISGADFDGLVREMAERCASATLSQLGGAAIRMNAAQLRGYVRAHAWPQIWAETQEAESKSRLTMAQANELAAKTLEQTVHLVTVSYLSAPVVAMPAPHIGRRAAA
jgi:hypothetical protein